MPSSAAYELAGPVHIASESAKLARARFLKLIGVPTFFLPDRLLDGARYDIISNWENALRSSHSARYAIGAGVDLQVRSWQILLQKSKIERL
jgi:hypothetical protein